jgi:hypothetical protein
VPGHETRELLLDTDQADTGGQGRVARAQDYPVREDGVMEMSAPSRSGLVFGKKPS